MKTNPGEEKSVLEPVTTCYTLTWLSFEEREKSQDEIHNGL
jgi:hypothetical protein